MVAHLTQDQKFDLSILLGAFLALYWTLYIDSLTGGLLGLALGSLPVLAGVYRYIDPDQYVHQTLPGLAAVALGGAAPATILYGTPTGNWLVGSQPLPLALGLMLVVVTATLVWRRTVRLTATVGEQQPN